MALAGRVVSFAKLLVMGASAVTALCMSAVVSLQFGFWLLTKTWSPFPVSRFLELGDINLPRRYLPASIEASQGTRFDAQGLIETLLDLPAIVVLFVALALLALCYAALTSLEKGLAGHET
jgi:hypothetical protein